MITETDFELPNDDDLLITHIGIHATGDCGETCGGVILHDAELTSLTIEIREVQTDNYGQKFIAIQRIMVGVSIPDHYREMVEGFLKRRFGERLERVIRESVDE